jgi:hypothetical protein
MLFPFIANLFNLFLFCCLDGEKNGEFRAKKSRTFSPFLGAKIKTKKFHKTLVKLTLECSPLCTALHV